MPEQVKKTLVLSIYFALAVSTLLVFWQVRNFDFVNYDDDVYVYKNPHILRGLTADGVIWAFTAAGNVYFWHPLTWLSHILDWQLYGSNAGGHHITSLIFHIANTLLLFIVLKRMTGAIWPSAFVAALFALHPLHVESVVWVYERKDVLSTFFWLLTMWAYVRYVGRPKITNYLLIVVFLALGLMAKPMLVTLPFVLLLLDYWPLERFNTKRSLSLLIEKVPLFAMVFASCIVTFINQRKIGAMFTIENLSLFVRLANASISYMQYIIKMIWPSGLAVFYPHPVENISVLYAAISAAVLLAVTILVIRFAKNHRYLATGWFWYLGTLVPVIGIVQVGSQAYADRYTYIPYIGLFIMLAWYPQQIFSKWTSASSVESPQRKIVLGLLMIIVLTTLGICAHRQTSFWNNNISLFSHAIEVTQNNYLAYNNRGITYNDLGRYTDAIEDSTKAVKINPSYAIAYNNLGVAYGNLGRGTEEIDAYNQAIRIKPDCAEAYYNLGAVYGQLSRYQEAIEAFRQAIRIKSDFAEAHFILGFTYLNIGNKSSALEEYKILKTLDAEKAVKLFNLINK